MKRDGIFFSPFGWGFYSPWWVSQAPFYGGYGYGRFGRGYAYTPRVVHHFSSDYHNWGVGNHYATSPRYTRGIYQGAGSSGGFHSGARFGGLGGGMRGGGFGGGMRSGGFGGGAFHGSGFHGGVGFHGGGGFHSH